MLNFDFLLSQIQFWVVKSQKQIKFYSHNIQSQHTRPFFSIIHGVKYWRWGWGMDKLFARYHYDQVEDSGDLGQNSKWITIHLIIITNVLYTLFFMYRLYRHVYCARIYTHDFYMIVHYYFPLSTFFNFHIHNIYNTNAYRWRHKRSCKVMTTYQFRFEIRVVGNGDFVSSPVSFQDGETLTFVREPTNAFGKCSYSITSCIEFSYSTDFLFDSR